LNFFSFFYVIKCKATKIKKIVKISIIILLVLFSIPATSFILLQNKKIQTYLAGEIAQQVSENLRADFSIESVDMILFNRVVLKTVLLKDQYKDTLLYSPRMVATLKKFNYPDKIMKISKLSLHEPTIRFSMDPTNTVNVEFLVESIRSLADTSKKSWMINVTNIELSDARFLFLDHHDSTESDFGLDFSDIHLASLNTEIRQFQKTGDTIDFYLDNISFTDQSGFYMKDMSGQVSLSPRFMQLRDALFEGPDTRISAEILRFDFDSYQEFARGKYGHEVGMDFLITQANVSFNDLSYIIPQLRYWKESFRLSGQIRGKVDNLKGRDLILSYNSYAAFTGDFDMIGLPDFRETFMFFDIQSLDLDINNLDALEIPGKSGEKITISETLSQLGAISYKGNFTGFIDDFVSYGRFNTDLGMIASDISIKPDTSDIIRFNGELETEGFNLGSLLPLKELVGQLSMQGIANGFFTREGEVYANMDGSISLLHFNEYDYQNINLSGELSKNTFDGSFNVEDPNLRMDFFGRIDFSDTIPEFNFTTEIDRARLYPLNISHTDPDYILSCLVEANFRGRNLDEYEGKITLLNSLYQKSDKQIQIYDFVLEALHSGDTNKLLLSSNLVDAEISGSYNFVDIFSSAASVLSHHFPEYSSEWNIPPPPENPDENHFTYRAHFKNTYPITDFFVPDLEIARNSLISGTYDPAGYVFEMEGEFPYFRFKDNIWEGLALNLDSDDSLLILFAESSEYRRGTSMNIQNILLDATASLDSMEFALNWLNESSSKNTGNVSGYTRYIPEHESEIHGLLVSLNPGGITINDTIWDIQPGLIRIDSSYIEFSGIMLQHNQQHLLIDGIVSEVPQDQLLVRFQQFDLNHINRLSMQKNIIFQGVLEGYGSISDLYNNPLFLSDITVSDLTINEELLGRTSLAANWINSEKKIHIDLKSLRGNLKTIGITGDYYPGNRELDFSIELDKLRMNVFRPYLKKWVSDVNGIASGNLSLDGNLKQPEFNGEIDLQKSSFRIDYLQTMYNFSDKIQIDDNQIEFRNIEIFDEEGNVALMNGTINNTYLRDHIIDLQIEAQNFYFLNTREKDNSIYYGTAVASGLININGPTDDLRLNITATTKRNTQLFIPLYKEGDISENNFITFDYDGQMVAETSRSDKYEVRLSGVNMVFDLEVTPDAEVQIIFDPQVGDILTGNGRGSITLEINDRGDFEMFGDYAFTEGDYLFTLQNIINKRLKIQQGGTISWNGDPMNAIIDMQAIYSTKAAPYVLVPSGPEYLKKRLPVDCHLIMTDNLMNPNIGFNIELPTAEEETKNYVRNAINTDEELTKQFLSLLVMSNFSSNQAGTASGISGSSAGMAGVTTSELLSNQLSNWLSQISSDFDIGVNYRPGDEISTDQVEVALSTQILDDRVTIHTNVDVSGAGEQGTSTGANTSNIAGEFDLDVKLTDDGKLRVKAFNHSNDDQLYKTSPYTQGVGFVYGEDFNSFRELRRRYFGRRKTTEGK